VKVLLAVDRSLHAEQAVRALRECLPGAEIEILHVIDLEANPHSHLSAALIEEYHRKLRTALQEEANRFLPRLQAVLVPIFRNVCVSVREGRTAELILEAAASTGSDLIVLGSRGLSEIQSLLLGSVSYRVVHEAKCPVLVVKNELPTIRKILLAVDRSEGAERAIRFLAKQVLFPPCPVIALTVCPSPPFAGLLPESARHHELASASEYLRKVAESLSPQGFAVETRIAEGDPAAVILILAEKEGVDLIVTGARRLHGLKRWLLGSVSRKVMIHATKSVLIVHGDSDHVAGV
jgi:nucleotide-binding universal stress UspA family protein